MDHSRRFLLGLALMALGSGGALPQARAQGCMPGRFISLSLGPDGITQLPAGQWQVDLSYRHLYADQGWMGTNAFPQYSTVVGNRITIDSFDLQATYAFTSRYSTTLTLPYFSGETSNPREHDGVRHEVHASGVGDMRLVGTAWLFDPATHPNGNLSLGLGVKIPTGNEAATATFYKSTGPEVRPVDISIQPGDGGWGIQLELAAYHKIVDRFYGYANGYYLINPRETNSAYTTGPLYGQVRVPLSVPDQYQFRAGLSWTIWPAQGLTVQLGVRYTGVPAHDLVGGSEGFRRPGYVVYVEPGVSWSFGRNNLTLFIPSRVDANRIQNVYEERLGLTGGGAFASHLLIASFSRKF